MVAESGEATILYVDPEADRADRSARLLEAADDCFAVQTVSTAREALTRLDTEPVDCILSAYELSGIDTIQFLQTVRAEYPTIPFILFTTAPSEEILSAAISAGVSDHFDRPDHPSGYQELADRIRAVVDRERARQSDTATHEQATSVLEAAPDGIVVSVDRELVYANPAATDLFGRTETELLGADPVSLTGSDPELWDAETTLTRSRGSISTADGEPVLTELTTNTVEWQDSTGVVAVLRDVSEQPEMNTEDRAHLEGIVDSVSADITTQQHRQHALSERIKELSTVHQVVELFDTNERPVADLLAQFVNTLLDSFQYPDRTEARISYGDQTAATDGFDESFPAIEARGRTPHGPDVQLTVACCPSGSEDDLFSPEEQELLDTLSSVVAGSLERRSYFEDLQRYETTLRALGDPVYALDSNGYFTFVNDALLDRTGYDRAELLGEHASKLLTSEGYDQGETLISRLASEQTDTKTAKWEMEVETVDGELIPVENHIALLPFDDGGFQGTAGVIRDITERTERERELRRRKALLVRTERMADVGGWELDTESDQLYWTEGTRLIHDVPESYEPTPQDAIEFYHPEDRERIEQAVRRCRKTGEPYDLELRLITAEGRERWVHTRGESVTENGSKKLRGTILDITEIRENKQQLTVLTRVLRHNLRNNLNVVTANAELLREQLGQLRSAVESHESADSDDIREALAAFPFEEALDNVEQLEANAWELLGIADKSRELTTLIDQIDRTEQIDLQTLLSPLISEYQQQYPAATIRVETSQTTAEVNPESVHFAVEELLENALKHTGPEPVVEITVDRPSESRLELRIEDDGPGIPANERQALEEGQETALTHSSGFGLWTVNWLLARTGGAVSIDETESGTCVRVDLPAA